jgi:hypothetical protein
MTLFTESTKNPNPRPRNSRHRHTRALWDSPGASASVICCEAHAGARWFGSGFFFQRRLGTKAIANFARTFGKPSPC